MEDPLEYTDFDEVFQHGDPGTWKARGQKAGSGVPANSPAVPPGTLKIYEIYEDQFGEVIEVHHPDGSVSDVKVKPRS
jgi:hypothetical protein